MATTSDNTSCSTVYLHYNTLQYMSRDAIKRVMGVSDQVRPEQPQKL